MYSTTSCDCDNLHCRSQVSKPESQRPIEQVGASFEVFSQSPESPPPSLVQEEASFEDFSQSPDSPPSSLIEEENVPFPVYTQSFLEEENDNAMDVGEGTLPVSEKEESREDDKENEKKKSAGCQPEEEENAGGYDSSDSECESSQPKKGKLEESEIEIERRKEENERYETLFSNKFKKCNKNCNVSLSQFYIEEIEKLSGMV
jgi:hypothetical protein